MSKLEQQPLSIKSGNRVSESTKPVQVAEHGQSMPFVTML